MAKFDDENFETQLIKYGRMIEDLKKYQNMLLEQYTLLDSQEFEYKHNVLNGIELSINDIKRTICDLECAIHDGRQIILKYNDAEKDILQMINNTNTDINTNYNSDSKHTQHTINSTVNNIDFKHLRFIKYVPTIFSKNILIDDWLMDLIQRLQI
ncbi:MAG: hypothetical protein LIO71_06760 [Ruminococcus sp.]|nr:hypothetical protein [Ruminococcus sp.]MCD7800108.1 hypothetical protein [Ruminococcus sp.]